MPKTPLVALGTAALFVTLLGAGCSGSSQATVDTNTNVNTNTSVQTPPPTPPSDEHATTSDDDMDDMDTKLYSNDQLNTDLEKIDAKIKGTTSDSVNMESSLNEQQAP